MLALLLLGGSATTSGYAAPSLPAAPQSPPGQDVDLCALLPSGEGLKVEPGIESLGGRFQSCNVSDNRRGEKHTFFTFSIARYKTVDQARADFKYYDYEHIPPGTHGEKWVPTTAFGDPGFAFEMAAVPPSDPSNPSNTQVSAKLKFARGPYVVTGDAGWKDDANYTLNDAGEIHAIAVSVDGALNAAVGPIVPEATSTATEVTVPGASATATTQAELDLRIDHMEVVQVVQRQGNEIPLVAGKKTVVRVFVQASGKALGGVASNVRGSLFVWPEGKSEVEVQPFNGAINVVIDAAPKRSETDSSLNFIIPTELTGAGVFSLKAKINPTHEIKETNYDNNELTEPFEFVQRNGLRIGFVRIGYKPPGTTEWKWPGTSIQDYATMMRTLFPAADNSIQYYELPWRVRAVRPLSTTDLGDDLNWTLREFYDRIQGDKPDMLVGWLPNEYASTLDFGGLAETVLSGQVARVALAVDFHSSFSYNHVLPHEVAHNLGLKHTATKSDPSADCRIAPNNDPNYWPKEYNDSATIHEVGFDTGRMIAIPEDYYDLMSYCGDKKPWISPFHYKKLYDVNLRPQAAFVTDRGHVMWVRGWATLKGDAAQLEVVRPPDAVGGGAPVRSADDGGRTTDDGFATSPSLANHLILPLYASNGALANTSHYSSFVLRPSSVVQEGNGNHCLRFLDASASALYERCFDLEFQSEETMQPIDKKGFTLEVPASGNVASVVLVRTENGQAQELTSLKVSSHAPTLTITSPKANDLWEGEHTITWSGSDEDGDALRYDILYSPDGKQSWYPLDVGSHDSEYTFSTDEVLPSEQTYIRVLASDGFNTIQTDVGPLVIPKQANSPNPPPLPPGNQPQPQPQPSPTPSGGPDGAVIALIVGTALMVIVGFGLLFVFMRRSRTQQAMPGMYGMPGVAPQPTQQPWKPYPNPPPSPPAPNLQPPAIAARFRWAEQEYSRLRGELAVRRINPQQFQAAIGQLRIQDAQGRAWMLDAQSGRWLMYDGRAWVWADPYRQG
jgi:hypothetical protein